MFLELVDGMYSNRVSLISNSFRMLSTCVATLVALIASYLIANKANMVYTYGYKRFEVIAGLFNGIFLVFVTLNILFESFERFQKPHMV